MPMETVIHTLNATIRSIRESIWLIDLAAEEVRVDDLSPSFQSRIADILSSHLEEAVTTIEYAQYLIKRIETERSNQSPSQSSSMTDSDRSTNS